MAADEIDGEALRRAAIDAASDAGLRAMLEAATVTAAAAGGRWESSHGAVQGYRVTVALCAEHLGAIDGSPAARDLLERAFAVAVAAGAGRAMTALDARWSRRGIAHEGSYRGGARSTVDITLAEGLRRFLQARGDARAGDGVDVEEVGGRVVASAQAPWPPGARRPVEAALRGLLGDGCDVRWRTR